MATQEDFPRDRLGVLTGHNGSVHAVTYSAGLAQYLLTGSSDRTIRLFNPARASTSSALIQTYSAHGYDVLDLSVSADNARFASVGGDRAVLLWDVASGATLRRFRGHAARVNACAFGGEGDGVLVSGSYDGTVRLWDVRAQGGREMMCLGEARDSVSAVRVVGADIVAASVDGRVRTYDVRMGELTVDVIGHPVTSLTPTKRAESLLVSSLDSTLRLLDRASGKLLQAYTTSSDSPHLFQNTSYRVRSALGCDENVVLSGSENGVVAVWDVMDGSRPKYVLRHAEGGLERGAAADEAGRKSAKRSVVSAVAFCPARREWVSAGGDGNVVVWGDAGGA
ncbi:WD40-repeat-containing domain protein [Lineolata rhizophorae]|uniref:WD40-repeat-containing domain protein n=1 Tax=Lineolata rhizophorae TaxID=578093 RepID=A0A6A6NV70_9PEZI|nr:WD40-repeat-containing domain protein [Lineolata rhizophorae]